MSRRRSTRLALAGLSALALLGLAACGNETTTEGTGGSSSTTTTSATPTTSATTGTSTPQTTASGIPEETVAPASEYNAQPQPATTEQSDFLDALTAEGIDLSKTDQEQLIATGRQYCAAGESDIIVNAVAGQLIEQGAATGSPEAVASNISRAAKDHLCP